MKSKIILFLTLALTGLNGKGQSSDKLLSSNNDDTVQSKFDVRQLSLSNWNTRDGIPYVQVSGANLGATSFEILDKTRVAYLCNASNEIIIMNMDNGKSIKKLPVLFAPRDFVYDHECFFVLGEKQVIVYDTNGKEINQFIFPDPYFGTERLARYGDATFLLLSSDNSLKIEERGFAVTPREYEGWITSTGYFIKTQLRGDSSYLVKVIQPNGKSFSKEFTIGKKVAGVFIVGSTTNRVVLDVQTFISENPVSVERLIVSVDLQKDDLGAIISSIKVPDCYYVLSNKEFDVSPNGNILNMITSPQGAYIFSLRETKSNLSLGYPASVTTTKYHFNNHIIEMDKK